MKDALDESLILSDRIIQDLVVEIVVDIAALYNASEAVALLDMLWSFAHAAISTPINSPLLSNLALRELHQSVDTVSRVRAEIMMTLSSASSSS